MHVGRIALVCLVLAARSVHADPSPKSRTIAYALSGAGTGVASLLMLGGFMLAPSGQELNKPLMYSGLGLAAVAPSFGDWYAGQWLTWGQLARAVGVGVAVIAFTTEMQTVTCDDAQTVMQTCTQLRSGGFALLGLAAIAFVGGMAYDVRQSAVATDRWNADHGFSATIVPTVMIAPTGASVPGLAFAGRF